MNNLLEPVQHLLTFIKAYCLLPLIVVGWIWTTVYQLRLMNAAWADIRNSGSGIVETTRIAHQIHYQRWSKRDLPMMLLYGYLCSVAAILFLSLIYG
jgi:hypothetical protein